jgi:hypothetical protein
MFLTALRPTLEPARPSVQWVLRALSPWVKLPGHDADHLTPNSVEIKNYTAASIYVIMECKETAFEDTVIGYVESGCEV